MLGDARHWWRDVTLLCVTHDVAETRDFDRVIVIEGGRIVEDGAPARLAVAGSRYHALLEAEARRVLDRILASMAEDLRDVFVMAELEEMTMADIAVALEIPPGTVASRLRRARAWFEQAAASIDEEAAGGTP